MTDTHSHIYGPEFDEDREDVILRAQEAGVSRILLPNINRESIAPMLSLCQAHPGYCHPMMGLHPTDLEDDYREVLEHMHQLLLKPDSPYIAVGEVGIDLYWDQSRCKQQLEAFEIQIEWARDLHLPLVIHSRSAHAELMDLMSRHRSEGLTGIFHCFGGSLEEARDLLSFEGFVLGVGGVLTYRKSILPSVLQELPLERIVLETDSPYLAPVPHRGKRNESAYVVEVARRLADIHGITVDEVASVTDDNVQRIFFTLNVV